MRKASLSVVNLKVIAVIGPFGKIAVKDVERFSENIQAQNFSRPGCGCCGDCRGCGKLPERYMVEICLK